MTPLQRARALILDAVRLRREAPYWGLTGYPPVQEWCLDQAERSLADAIGLLDGLPGGAAEGARGAAAELRGQR